MAGPIIHALSLPQWGLETNTAPGTPSAAVAATGKMAVKDFLIKPTDLVIRDQILKGLLTANRGNEIIGERGTDWEVPETPLVFGQFHYWQGMAIVAPTKTGVGPFIWTSAHTPTALQARHMRTIELGLGDGTNTSDWEIPACFLKELEVIGAANSPVRFRASGSGRRLQSSTRTAALALPAIQEVPMALTKVYIDSTWATLGTTQVTGQIIGWRWKLTTGLFGQQTADGRSDQDFIVVVANPDEFKWTLEIDIKANLNTGQWQTEKTAAEALTLRAIRVQADITGVEADQLKIDGLYKHTEGSVFPQGRDNGEVTATLSLEGSTDDTNTLSLLTQNGVTAAVS